MNIQEEEALIVKAKSKDPQAIRDLWDQITPSLYGYLKKVLRNTPAADDVLQNTWVKAIEHIEAYAPKKARFRTWLFAIARNECKMHWRRMKKETPLPEDMDLPASHDLQKDAEDLSEIDHIFSQLSQKEREILGLRYISDLSFDEIARVLEIRPATARVRHHRALARAKKMNQSVV